MTPTPPKARRARNRAAALLLAGLTALPALAGCSQNPGFAGVPSVREADSYQVASCTYLTDIGMEPGVYGPLLAQQGLKYARNKVKADALNAGANTVVFDKVAPGADVWVVHAKAYRC